MMFVRRGTEKFSVASFFPQREEFSLNFHEAKPDNDTSICNILFTLHIWQRIIPTPFRKNHEITKLASYGDSAVVLVFTGACVVEKPFRRQLLLNTNFAECSFDFTSIVFDSLNVTHVVLARSSSADKPEIFKEKKFQQKSCRNLEMNHKKLLITT